MSTRPAAESDWATPVNMGQAVNSSAYDAEPCLSSDGLALFFCSNRSGGMGSYDIWLTTRPSQAAAWSPPVNLGPPINTSGMEGMPCLSPDWKTLYFGTGDWEAYEAPIVPILDFNGDGIVDAADLCRMADHWGEDETSCDVDPMPWGDGLVDFSDLLVLTEYWLRDLRLLAHWKMDEMEGGIAHDSIGGKDGHGPPDLLWRPQGGKVGGAVELDGIDDSLLTTFSLNPRHTSFSVFAWVKGGAPGQVIVSQSGGMDWLLADEEGKLMTMLRRSPFSPTLGSECLITDNEWHRIGFAWDGSHRHLYVDGTQVAEDTADVMYLWASTGNLCIGGGANLEAGSYFSGLIDDVRIYNRAIEP
jgi:hypothetical protein